MPDSSDDDLLAFLQRALAAQRAVDQVLPREQQALERMPDGTFRVRCSLCGKSVSNALPVALILRAFVQCPECLSVFPKEGGQL